MKNIPFYDYERMYQTEQLFVSDAINDVLRRSDFILRDDLSKFEVSMAEHLGARHAIGVGNGTDAIWLALLVAGIKSGDEVILPAHTYIATADAVKFVGATPVLVDCDKDHSISVDAIESAITERTAAIIPVNLNGRSCRLEEISRLAVKQGLKVIEDNAQGLGAMLNGKFAGTFGDLSTLSFFPAKILGCYGDGGAVITNSDEMSARVFELRNHGRDTTGEVVSWGFNSRLDNLQAAILNSKLPKLAENIRQRREIAKIYISGLSDIQELALPDGPSETSEYFDSFQNFEVEAEKRDELREYLKANGIGTILPWAGKAVHQFGLPGMKIMDVSRTDSIFRKVMLLPMNQYLDKLEARRIIDVIREYYGYSQFVYKEES
jgi:dTDP-4-amino-4,6-dideoxygalactose transaminase